MAYILPTSLIDIIDMMNNDNILSAFLRDNK